MDFNFPEDEQPDLLTKLARKKWVMIFINKLIEFLIISFYAVGLLFIFREKGFTVNEIFIAYLIGTIIFLVLTVVATFVIKKYLKKEENG